MMTPHKEKKEMATENKNEKTVRVPQISFTEEQKTIVYIFDPWYKVLYRTMIGSQ